MAAVHTSSCQGLDNYDERSSDVHTCIEQLLAIFLISFKAKAKNQPLHSPRIQSFCNPSGTFALQCTIWLTDGYVGAWIQLLHTFQCCDRENKTAQQCNSWKKKSTRCGKHAMKSVRTKRDKWNKSCKNNYLEISIAETIWNFSPSKGWVGSKNADLDQAVS